MTKILAIDDQKVNLTDLKYKIRKIFPGAKLFQTLSGKEGIDLAIRENPDVILLDVLMPDMDGFDVCKILKSKSRTKDIPVIFLTVLDFDRENRIKALNAGGDAFLKRTADEIELKVQIAAMLKIRKASTRKKREKERLNRLVEERTRELQEELKKRKNAEKWLLEKEERFRGIVEGTKAGYFFIDKDGYFRDVNNAWLKMHGFNEPREIIGKHFSATQTDSTLNEAEDIVKNLLNGVEVQSGEFPRKCKDGSVKYHTFSANPVISGEEVVGLEGFLIDNTDFINLQKELSISKANLRSVIDSANEIIVSRDREGRAIVFNKGFEQFVKKLFGVEAKPGIRTTDYLPQSQNKYWENVFENVLKGEIHKEEFEWKIDEEQKYFEITITPIYVGNEIIGTAEYNYDITERKLAEKRIRDSEEKYKNLFNNSEVGMFRTRVDGSEILEFNEKYLEILECTEKEVKGRPSSDFWVDKKERDHMVQLLKKNGRVTDFECSLKNNRGNILKCLTSLIIYPDTEILEGSIQDITERKRAEDFLRKSEERHRTIIQTAMDGFWVTDMEGNLLEVNQTYCKMSGYSEEVLVTKNIGDISAITGSEEVKLHLSEIKRKGTDRFETKHKRKDGSVFDVEISIKYQPEDGGKMVVFIEDITERKKNREKLIESEEKFRLLITQMEQGLAVHEAIYNNKGRMVDYRFLDFNESFAKQTGLKRSESIGKTVKEVLPSVESHWISEYEKVVKSGKAVRFENYSKEIGRYFEVVAYRNRENQFATVITDTTERRKNVRELNLHNERLKALLNIYKYELSDSNEMFEYVLQEAINLTESKIGFIFFYNESTKQFKLCSWSGKVMKECGIIEPETTYDLDSTGCWTEAVRTRSPFMMNDYSEPNIHKKGIPKGHVELKKFLTVPTIVDNKIKAIIGVANKDENYEDRDIQQLTLLMGVSLEQFEKKRHQQELKITKEQLQKVTERLTMATSAAEIGIWDYDIVNNKLIWDEQMYKLYHAEPSENGIAYETWKAKIHPDDLERCDKEIQDAINGINDFNTEFRVIWPDGTIRNIRGIAMVIHNKAGKSIRMIGTNWDITDIKETENELIIAKEQAEENDRLKSAFLANMSHEIRTPMNGILGFTGLLKNLDLSKTERENYLNIIEKSGERLLNTINDLIDISKIESNQMEVVTYEINLNDLMDYLFSFFDLEATKKGLILSYSKEFDYDKAFIRCDKDKLNAVLMNLLKNAVKYTSNGNIDFGYTEKNGYIEFFVKDTGIGISTNRQQAVFDRFVQADISTTRPYEGAGLGLAIAKAYVEMMGGKIWLLSEKEKGSQFSFKIPYKAVGKGSKTIGENKSNTMTDDILSKLTVLVVDDDEVGRIYLEHILGNKCKKVIYAINGKEAVDLFRKNNEIEVILMDIKMPEMDGYSATSEIKKINSNVLVIVQSAYALPGEKEKAIEAGCDAYLTKPLTKDELLETIETLYIR